MYRNLQWDVKMSINYDSLFSFKSKLRLWWQSPVEIYHKLNTKQISVDKLVQWQYHEGSFRRCFFLSRHALIDKLILTARWTVTLLCCPCRTQKSTRRCEYPMNETFDIFHISILLWSIAIFFSLVCWHHYSGIIYKELIIVIDLRTFHCLIKKSATRLKIFFSRCVS